MGYRQELVRVRSFDAQTATRLRMTRLGFPEDVEHVRGAQGPSTAMVVQFVNEHSRSG